jgi:hypothetical protein
VDCKADVNELAAKCSYCFEEDHRKGDCQKKREDEKEERQKFKMEKKDPVLDNPWQKKPAKDDTNDNENKDTASW